MSKKLLQVLYLLGVIAAIFMFFELKLDVYFTVQNIDHVKEYFLSLGNWAFFYILLVHILLNITGIPRVFFTIFAGYVYGIFVGFVISWIATMAGLMITFILVRYLFRQSFEQKFGNRKVVERINIQIDKYGIWIVVFLRAIYIVPSSILNYSFGFTKIKTKTYYLGSAIGFFPVVLLNVWAGDALAKNIFNKLDYKIIVIGILILGFVLLSKHYYKKFSIWS